MPATTTDSAAVTSHSAMGITSESDVWEGCYLVSAPGKVILFGEHAVVYGKVRGGRITKGRCIDIKVKSSIPIGSGLGSSASYSVCISTALLLHFNHTTVVKLHSKDNTSASASKSELDLVNEWAFVSEKVIHGNPSGIDNSLCTFGGAKLYKKGSMEPLDGYDTKKQVANVRQRKDLFPNVMNPIMESVQGISDMCKATFQKMTATTTDSSSPQTSSPSSDLYATLEALIDMNHCLMAAAGVSHPSLEKVREITHGFGLTSKLTGAGGGGCALTLVGDDVTPKTLQAIKSALSAAGFSCFETSVGCPGVCAKAVERSLLDANDDTSSWVRDFRQVFASNVRSNGDGKGVDGNSGKADERLQKFLES
ncbi:hypothetical protein HK102_006308 [Quaeritorhiza haematococci]|nr:hypothetical protein HK102_006308 [Quaeritorhiza haematococci]